MTITAVILAAGHGKRMGKITADSPKCMVTLAGRSLLDHQLAALRACGCDDIAIVTGHGAESVPVDGLQAFHNSDFSTTNMVATLFRARALMEAPSDLLVVYGDIVFEPDIVRRVMACPAPLCIPSDIKWKAYWELRMADPLQDAETFRVDDSGFVTELGKKPSGYNDIEGQYIGMFKVRADWAARLPAIYDSMDRQRLWDGQTYPDMYMTRFLQHLIDSGWRAEVVPVENGWLEVDTPEDLILYERLNAEGNLGDFCRLG